MKLCLMKPCGTALPGLMPLQSRVLELLVVAEPCCCQHYVVLHCTVGDVVLHAWRSVHGHWQVLFIRFFCGKLAWPSYCL